MKDGPSTIINNRVLIKRKLDYLRINNLKIESLFQIYGQLSTSPENPTVLTGFIINGRYDVYNLILIWGG